MSVTLVPLGEVATITAGQSPPSSTYNEAGIGLPFFQGKADFGQSHPIVRKWCSAPRKTAEAGDILISVRAPVGPTNIAGQRCCIGRGLSAVRPNESVVLSDFVHWIIKKRQPALVAKAQGSTFVAIGQKDLKSLPIPLLPLDEQRRIVDILNRAAKIERLRAKAAECLREFVPALFIKMFGDPVTNPMGWESQTLGELSTLGPQYGANARATALVTGQPRYVRITDIQASGDLTGQPVGINADDWEPYRLIEGDLLFARSGATVGKTYLHRSEDGLCVFAGYLIRFRLAEERLHPLVAFAFTQTPHYSDWVKARRRTAAQPNINGREYASLELPVPDREVQEQFVGMLIRAAVVRDLGEQCNRNAVALSASLLDGLLDGSE